jgi:hypothetical protein
MFHKQKAFYTPVWIDKVELDADFETALKSDILDYIKNDTGDKYRTMLDGRKGYYSTSMTYSNCKLHALKQLVQTIEEKVITEIDPTTVVGDFGINCNPTGTYQPIINGTEVKYNCLYIIDCDADMGIANGEYRLINPNSYASPLYHSVPVTKAQLYVWPGPVFYEMLSYYGTEDRLSLLINFE